MAQVIVLADTRTDFGKNASRRLRVAGKIPGVVYGHGLETRAIAVDPKAIHGILHSGTGRNTIFSINVAGDMTDVLVRDFQLDPVKSNLIHVDFQHVAMDEVMEFEVPVEVHGTPKGVKAGGILDIVLRQITVECLPADVPAGISINAEGLDIGDTVRVSDLMVDASKLKILNEADLVVLTVVPPRVEAEPLAAGEEPAEPEVIKKGKAEAEEEA